MKLKHYTIDDNGDVQEVSPLSRGLSQPEVAAPTKSEATRALLKLAKGTLSTAPELFFSNGAFCLIYHNGTNLTAETGTFQPSRLSREGRVSSLCISGHKTIREALEKSSFSYYASEEYRAASAA